MLCRRYCCLSTLVEFTSSAVQRPSPTIQFAILQLSPIAGAATPAAAGVTAPGVAVLCAVQVVGGVGCNMRLQSMLRQMAARRGCGMGGMDERYCIDNGAMIAYVGLLMFKEGSTINPSKSFYRQRFRTDEVDVTWRKEEMRK